MLHKKRKVFIPVLMTLLASCVDQGIAPSSSEVVAPKSITYSTNELITPVDVDPTTRPCYSANVEFSYEGEEHLFLIVNTSYEEVECAGGEAGEVGETSCTLTFPVNPANGQKFVATAGSCRSGAYYYSCIGNTWVTPADHLYGTPPSSPSSGLRYLYDYTNESGGITFIYLANTGSGFLPDGWYVDVFPVASSNCGGGGGGGTCTKCTSYANLGAITKNGYVFIFYGASATSTSGSVIKVTARPTSGSTTTTLSTFSITYTQTSTDVYHITGSAKAPNGTTVNFNDTIYAP